jgi:hypothetical protein
MNTLSKYLWPALAVIGGGAAAALYQSPASTKVAAYSASAVEPALPQTMPRQGEARGDLTAEPQANTIRGKVLEVIVVPKYTYLRLLTAASGGQKQSGDTWVAVSNAPVTVGQTVTVVGAQRMDNFKSTALNRTFELIYFGVLGGSDAQPEVRDLPPGHPDISGAKDAQSHLAVAENSAAMTGDTAASAHASPTAGGDGVEVGNVERASGPLGHTVAELVRGRKTFAGQKVRVRGVVVKNTSGVLGKNFVHVRDGSGSAKNADHDLTITTQEEVAVGAKVLFEGTVVTDKDFGAGYSYPILLENAQTVSE